MPVDIFTIAAVTDQLSEVLPGCRIDKVLAPSELSVGLKVWGRGYSGWLVASADPRLPHVYVTETKVAKGMETPTPFIMLLRKYCLGGRIEAVRQAHLERLLTFDIATHDFGTVSLIAELMGNRSNLILADSEDTILGALKLIGPRQSRIRRILPHSSYRPPPEPERRDPAGHP
ncbi:MAG TPA: NFACT family protein, partial [Chloroflexota bacterium]|nr:NFACT family protein [Chloroflexota bacterium]